MRPRRPKFEDFEIAVQVRFEDGALQDVAGNPLVGVEGIRLEASNNTLGTVAIKSATFDRAPARMIKLLKFFGTKRTKLDKAKFVPYNSTDCGSSDTDLAQGGISAP